MSRKKKGIDAERDLIHKFWGTGKWCALRTAGSGSMHFPAPDILASNIVRKVAIECKVTKDDKKYFPKDEVKQLKNFSEYFGAEPWIAVKFFRTSWFFLNIEDLRETKKSYVINKRNAILKGLSLKEFIGEGFE
ncbi:Holliday junction resolvase [Candidatus Woesearchaeota archaeon]|nr:Holliday junction resolvase [Candidatus Woesearchaeota archaeon]